MSSRYDLPLNNDMTARFVPKIVGLMVYLGTLCFVFTLFMIHSAAVWEKEFTTHLSIEIPTLEASSSNSVQSKVFELLNQTPGVQHAAPVPQKEMAALFRSLLGEDINIDLFSLPTVIDISLNDQKKVDLKALESSLNDISPLIHLTDHRNWQTQVSNLIYTTVFIALFITTLTLFAALASAIFATKTSLLIHHQVVEILSLIGASDSYIAKQFQVHALKQGFIASVIGSSLAFLTFFSVITLLEKADLPCAFNSSFFSQTLCVFVLAPFLTALTMMVSVRFAVMKALRQ